MDNLKQLFSWLHLTDLHVGQSDQGRLWPNVRDHFYKKDLGRLHKRSGPWDVVFFTGDLTQGQSVKEFDKLNETLAELISAIRKLQDSPPVLLAVPGNHDLSRPDPGNPVVQSLKAWHDNSVVRESFWSNAESNQYRSVVTMAFKPFTDWYTHWRKLRQKDYRYWRDGIIPGDFSITVEKEGLRIGIIGLNSAFLQLTDGDYHGRLAVEINQLNAVCGRANA